MHCMWNGYNGDNALDVWQECVRFNNFSHIKINTKYIIHIRVYICVSVLNYLQYFEHHSWLSSIQHFPANESENCFQVEWEAIPVRQVWAVPSLSHSSIHHTFALQRDG